jgi:hypothetical protein
MIGAALVAAGLAPRSLGRADEQALTCTTSGQHVRGGTD